MEIFMRNREQLAIAGTERLAVPYGIWNVAYFRAYDCEEDNEQENERLRAAFLANARALLSEMRASQTPRELSAREIRALLPPGSASFFCEGCEEELEHLSYTCSRTEYGNAGLTSLGIAENFESVDYGDSDNYTFECPDCGNEMGDNVDISVKIPVFEELKSLVRELGMTEATFLGESVTFVEPPGGERRGYVRAETPPRAEQVEGMPIDEISEEEDLISQQ